MLLLVSNSELFIYCIYGESWLPTAYYARIICFGALIDPIAYVAVQMFLVKGRTDLNLKREFWLRSLGFSAMIIGALHSVAGICYALILTSAFNAWISSKYIHQCSGITQMSQLRDITPYMLIAATSIVPCLILNMLPYNPFILLPLSLLCSAICFFGILLVKKDEISLHVFHSIQNSKLGKIIFRKKKA